MRNLFLGGGQARLCPNTVTTETDFCTFTFCDQSMQDFGGEAGQGFVLTLLQPRLISVFCTFT